MFSSILFTTLFAAIALSRADPDPSEPGPGDVYNEGSACHISWDPDTTGTWTTMYIELMTGSNTEMVHITTVATVDGTSATNSSYDYPCPEVTPNSAIYFYQFTSPNSSDTLWTTRFAIANSDGQTTTPTEATEPNGDAIPWGTGALVDPSLAVPAPGQGSTVVVPASSSASTASDPAESGSSSVAPAASSPAASSAPAEASSPSSASSGSPASSQSSAPSSGSKDAAVSSGSGASSSSASASPTGGAAAANGAVGSLAVNSRLVQAAATLGVVAFAYAVAL